MSAENNRTEWGVGMNGAERMLQNTRYDMLMMSDVKVENIWAIMIALMMTMLMMILVILMKRSR